MPGCVVEVFATAAGAALLRDVEVTPVDDRAIAALSDSVNPAGVVAVCRFLDVPLADALTGSRLVAVCADVRDPGNAGTVIRTADAAGADAVVLAGEAVDLHNPKTIRASVGSAFHLPVAVAPDAAAAVAAARAAGLTVVAADGAGETELFAARDLLTGPTAWLFGNEARGLPPDLAELADHRVRIPIAGRAESLNLATAAALCLFESSRRRPQPLRPGEQGAPGVGEAAARRRCARPSAGARRRPRRSARRRRRAAPSGGAAGRRPRRAPLSGPAARTRSRIRRHDRRTSSGGAASSSPSPSTDQAARAAVTQFQSRGSAPPFGVGGPPQQPGGAEVHGAVDGGPRGGHAVRVVDRLPDERAGHARRRRRQVGGGRRRAPAPGALPVRYDSASPAPTAASRREHRAATRATSAQATATP